MLLGKSLNRAASFRIQLAIGVQDEELLVIISVDRHVLEVQKFNVQEFSLRLWGVSGFAFPLPYTTFSRRTR
jgi:hypothetical protein